MLIQSFFCCLFIVISIVQTAPPNDKALFEEDAEGRIRRRRPCRGRTPEGRTFFDWSFQYLDVDYTNNYNVICGGGGGGGVGGNKPQFDHGGGHKPHKPHGGHGHGGGLLSNHLQNQQGGPGGGNRPFGNGQILNFVQSQSQSIFANLGSIWPQNGIGSLIPQNLGDSIGSLLPSNGGLFNGQGVSSLFENGLFSNIFNTRPSNPVSQPVRPPPPVSHNPGAPGQFPTRPPITTVKPVTQDPDDIIYNDEKPVHEEHDAIFPDPYYNRPGASLHRPAYRGRSSGRIRFNN